MGNSTSNQNSDTEQEDVEDSFQENEKDSATNIEGNLDLNVLFDLQKLREASSKLLEEAGPSLLQQHQSTLVRWIDDRKSRGEETVTLSQFTDFLSNRDIDKEVASEIFRQFDIEGSGVVDVDQFHEILVNTCNSSGIGFRDDLQFVNGLFQEYQYTPGFLDAFTDGKTVVSKHGKKLNRFLERNRAHSNAISVPALESFINTTDMRMRVLQAHLSSVKEKADMRKRDPPLQEDEVLKPITRCFTLIEVSSNRSEIPKLTDGDTRTFWQSDGPARSHWVRLKIAPNVVIRQLSINVASSDESYMPHVVVVSAGRDIYHLTEIIEMKVPSQFTGNFVLVENMKTYFPVIQLNIKRCHSDGCDTRVRQVKAIGYRVVKSKGVTVVDATAMWYLSVLASTAQAALPIAPGLRDAIIGHTKNALVHIQPLALSSMSSDKPGFLSNNVMEQMEKFLSNIVSMSEQADPNDLCILIEFAIARGSLGSIINVLKILHDRIDEEYDAGAFVKDLADVRDKAVRKHAALLDLSVYCCDGGSKETSSGPSNVLSNSLSGDAYLSSAGKKIINFAFNAKSRNLVTPTRAFIRVSRGAIGAEDGLVFVVDSLEVKPLSKKEKEENAEEDKFERLKDYNSWTSADYKELCSKIKNGYKPKEEDPVAYFSFDKDWDDTEFQMDRMKAGRFIVIKFLRTRQESAERMGVSCINLHGYEVNEAHLGFKQLVEKHTPLPENIHEKVSGRLLFLHILRFLDAMAADTLSVRAQNQKEQLIVEKDSLLDISDASMQRIWSLYKLASTRGFETEYVAVACSLILSVFHVTLPSMKASSHQQKDTSRSSSRSEASTENAGQPCAEVFQYLCDLVDDGKGPASILKIAQGIILDGAEIFFPDAQARREHLLSLVDQVMEEKKAVSVGYTFESLCRFFSNRDSSGLLGLPDNLPSADFDKNSVVYVMQTLVSVAFRECIVRISKDEMSDRPTNLVQLLCAMQKSLLNWCHTHCGSKNEEAQNVANYIVLEYVKLMSCKCEMVLQKLDKIENMTRVIDRLEHTFISAAMRQLVLFLNLFSTMDLPSVKLLNTLQSMDMELKKVSQQVPELFHQSTTDEWSDKQENVTLRTWDVESRHNYDNNLRVVMVFSCPGCTEFKVEFDPRCETERRYDYLEFTDSKDQKRKFDQKVGTSEWPQVVEFKAGQKLHFLFHSDGSNNEWGYKFKVSAIGRPDINVSWIFDLQLNISRLFGILCSNAIDCRKAVETQSEKAKKGEIRLLHNELWSSLFRGGYRVGKLQRSLSGYYGASPADSDVNGFLVKLVASGDEKSKALIQRFRASRTGHYLGGAAMDEAVHSVFAACVWHTQEMREQISSYVNGELPAEIPSCLMAAFTAAEGIRRLLLEARQKLCVLAEDVKEGDGEKDVEMVNPDAPIHSCKEKSLFLLKFAGLSKLPKKMKDGEIGILSRANSLHRSRSWNKHDSLEHKHSRSASDDLSVYERYPALKMVTDFVTNDDFSLQRIKDLLKQRHEYADNVSCIYSFSKDFLQQEKPSEVFSPHVILFLQQLLHCQHNFPRHYCDFLNGCGLEYENKVRKQFYLFIRYLSQAVIMGAASDNVSAPFFESCRAFLLHFLTVDWKPNDYVFLMEIELPKLLMEATKATASHPGDNMERFELQMHERHLNYFKEAKSMDIDKWCEKTRESAPRDVKRDINLFIARFSEHLNVQITCDGCGEKLSGRRYRCLNCMDMDLCAKCYENNEKPDEHTEEHEIIDLRYGCDNCLAFIVGTRIHCNECVDFDLCLGCFKKQAGSGQHQLTHSSTKFTMNLSAIYARPQDACSLKTYVHHYSWLMFSSLALSLSESLQEQKTSGLDAEYSRAAADLLLSCLNALADVLDSVKIVPDPVESKDQEKTLPKAESKKVLVRQNGSDEDPTVEETPSTDDKTEDAVVDGAVNAEAANGSTVPQADVSNVSMETSFEAKTEDTKEDKKTCDKTVPDADLFASVAQDKILGSLGALMPPNRQLSSYPNSEKFISFISTRLMPSILRLLRSDQTEMKVRIIALGVLSKTLRCVPPDVADKGVAAMEETSSEGQEASADGIKTVQLLFKLGAECLARADLDTASGLETLLKQLTCTGKWHGIVTKHANACLESLAVDSRNPSLPSLFALMFFAGFPDVYRMGTMAKVNETGADTKDVVIFDYNQDRGIVSAYNFKSRKLQMIKEHLIDDDDAWSEGTDPNRIPVLLNIIKDVLSNKKCLHSSVEQKWVRALVLKALLGNLKAGISSSDMLKIMNSSIISLVVNLACQGTRFSKQWLLRDLEILSWKLYKQVHTTVQPVKEQEQKDPLEGLGKDARTLMENIHDALNCSYPILRAMYETCGQDDEKLREEVQRNLIDGDGVALRVSEEIREKAKKWETEPDPKSSPSDSSVDIGVHRVTPQLKESKELRAKPESGEATHKFITSLTEAEKFETRGRQRRSKSAELLREELENKQRTDTTSFIKKVNHAVSVGYARHLVAWLFSVWPANQRITKTYLNNIDASKVVGLLDLIQEAENKEHFEKVVFNFVQLCDKELVKPLALSAVHSMGEVQLASVTKESEHKYKNNARIEDKVVIPGAISLFIRFDKRCATESKCDILTISSSPNYSQNFKEYSGTGYWPEFEMPGDTVYYKFTSDASNTDWGWKFTVTGGQLGRFETGCGILNGLLAQDIEFSRSLPLKQLWSWLIVVACNQVGQQRLMATGLLLRILQISAGDPLLFGENFAPLRKEEWPDLSQLRPLWALYTKTMTAETVKGTSYTLMSPVLRGLSELFLVVENVAQDLGLADELVARLATEDKLRKRLTQAVTNIAAIGLAIEMPNKALDILRNAPSCPTISQEGSVKESESQSRRRSSIIEITGNNSEWSGSDDDQEDDTEEEGDMEIDEDSSMESLDSPDDYSFI
ncbi:zinc finger ZZ-type and EF-hand domain-containing protein 1-like isoform X1 [Rhopilema esculentum]|uniref:zinc finger ZZ-type and EF-hand domain-containing protein 1-like isoform X1 n=1 Tax=Rhopilema esculentum TaxID=499914 RepID=UPI0031DB5852